MSKEEVSDIAIILRQQDYRDNDVIVNALSKQGEYLALYARGIKKVVSKNAYALQPFMESELTYFKNSNSLHLLKSAKANKNYFSEFKDYYKVLTAYMLLDVSNTIGNLDIKNNQTLFKLLKDSLKHLATTNNYLLLSFFLVNIMDLLGISLISSYCAICHNKQVNYISVNDGGFICANCLKDNNKHHETLEVLRLFQYINKANIEDLVKFDFKELDFKRLLTIIYEFYVNYSGFYIKNIEAII